MLLKKAEDLLAEKYATVKQEELGVDVDGVVDEA